MYDNKDWKYGFYYLYIDNTGKEFHNILNQEEKVIVNHLGGVVPVFTNVDKETVGQYTGLKDKNGVEIYEGDIVAEKGHFVKSDRLVYQKIQWKENYSCWLRGEYQRLTPKNIKAYQIEVIGNIYENPDLLEE